MSSVNLFAPRNVLFIPDFDFGDGGESADKLLIILHANDQDGYIIFALTTSQQKIPDDRLNHGWTNSADKLFSFFLFIKDRVIGKKSNGSPFSFDLNTFVFIRDNIRMQENSSFLTYMRGRVRVVGVLEDDEFRRLLKCIYKSNHIKLKIKKEFDKHSISN